MTSAPATTRSAATFYASDSFRSWNSSSSSSSSSGGISPPITTPEEVPVINLWPRLDRSQEGITNDDNGSDDDLFTFWRRTMRDRPLRRDGRGGLVEFFIPGSPTFVRTAQPALLALATVGGLAVLGAVLSV